MPGRHSTRRATAAPPKLEADALDVASVLRRTVLTLAATNAVTAFAFLFGQSGAAPSIVLLQAIAPLPAWGVAYGAAAVLLFARQLVLGHTLAFLLWMTWAAGAVFGLIGGSTRSPAVTAALTGLILTVAGLHANGMTFRRREAQARRAK